MGGVASQITSLTIVHSTVYSKKTSKLRVTGLCAGISQVIGEFPAQRASNEEMFQFDYVIMGSLKWVISGLSTILWKPLSWLTRFPLDKMAAISQTIHQMHSCEWQMLYFD